MKGSAAAMVYAAASLIPDKSRLAGTIHISTTVVEEIIEGVALGAVMARVLPDWVVIGESTDLNLNRGQRGRGEVELITVGRPAHSSNPQVGVNAAKKMFRLLAEIEKLPLPQSEFLGSAILELTDIMSLPYPGASVIPDRCKATLDRRLLVGETEEGVLAPIRVLIDRRPVLVLHARELQRRDRRRAHHRVRPVPGGSGARDRRVHRGGAADLGSARLRRDRP